MSTTDKPSKIFLDELFAGRDAEFFRYVRRVDSPSLLQYVVERWKQAPADWARAQTIAYFDEPLDCPGHELVVKRLFKDAEERGDDKVLAACTVTFDRLVRRKRRRGYRYDPSAQQYMQQEYLASPRDQIPQLPNAKDRRWSGLDTASYIAYFNRKAKRLFSYRTRYYLRRRAWRYYRRMGYQQPDRYVRAVATFLKRYTDSDFAQGENILDNWSMLHACYFHHDALRFTDAKAALVEGRSLAELTPAPYHDALWQQTEAFDVLIDLLGNAESSLIRLWALEYLNQHHRALVSSLTPQRLMPLLNHADERVQNFAAEAFSQLENLGSLGIDDWLALLKLSSISTLTLICDAMRKHVASDRLDQQQLLELACARPDPVARMGLEMVQARHAERPFAPTDLCRLAHVECLSIARQAAEWGLSLLGTSSTYHVEWVSPFFDSLNLPTRLVAMEWLTPKAPGWNDPALWARLIETPFDDVRLGVVQQLEQRLRLPGTEVDRLAPVWTAVILGVHRGGRRKPDALRQIIKAMIVEPAQVERLMPIVAVAVRSIRAPERRAALAALARLIDAAPNMQGALERAIPELTLPPMVVETA